MRPFAQLFLAALLGTTITLVAFELVFSGLQPKHKYSFVTRGVQGDKAFSLWRFDEVTGASCQLQSSESDGWIGGHCPQP